MSNNPSNNPSKTQSKNPSKIASRQPLSVTVEREIAASPDVIYGLISDVTRMGMWSPETTKAKWLGSTTGPAVGAKFQGYNAIGRIKWSTKPTVTEADPGRRFAFKVPGSAGPLWTYELTATPHGTLVRESMKQERRSPGLIRMLQRFGGVTDRETHLHQAMTTTLARLAAHVA